MFPPFLSDKRGKNKDSGGESMQTGAGARKKGTRIPVGRILPAVLSEGVLGWVKRMEEIGFKYFRRGEARRKEDPEDKNGNFLDGLPAGFFVLHDFGTGSALIDHILVSPKGIFVLKMEIHNGTVMVLGDQIFRNGRSLDSDKTLIKRAREECRILQELLIGRGITGLTPLPVILFTNAVVGVHGTIKGVEVMQWNALPAFMNRRKNLISAREAEGIFEFLKIGCLDSTL
jgi:hypothetical protein